MEKKKVSIIIVNFNGRKWLAACLKGIYEQNYKNFEIIVVDNASKDRSYEYIKQYYPKVKLIKNNNNYGYAEGNNIGFNVANGQYILFLNNDTEVTHNFLTELVLNIESQKNIACTQSKILLLNNKKYLDSVGAFLTFTGFLYHYGIAKPDQNKYNKKINIYSAKGACMLFKKSVLNEVLVNGELFDKTYFAYFEETDLCHRIWLAGYKIIFVPTSTVFHAIGGTSKKIENSFIQYHSFKNRINSYIKNLGLRKLLMIIPIHLFLCELFALISLIQLDIKLFFSIQKSIFWNIINIRNTLNKRYIIQHKIRKVTDDQIFQIIYKHPHLSYYFKIFNGLSNYEDE